MPRHVGNIIGRAILLLLVVRVVAAPVTLRPPAKLCRAEVVVRVCSWPAQQARSTSARLTAGERSIAPELALPHAGSPRLAAGSRLRITWISPGHLYRLRTVVHLRC